ncbi:ankyrin [Penicillium sp. IBT 35674x]|nr:ankyrin [Penicillium sp. IBT 35674x]
MIAVTEKHVEAVKALLVRNIGVNVPGMYDTPLTMACRMGSEELVRILLKHDADVNISDPDKWWPLHSACRYYTVTIVEIVLQKSSDVNVKIPDGWTPLHSAARYGETDMVKSILERNPECHLRRLDTVTCCHSLWQPGCEENPNIHAKDFEGWTPLHTAARMSKPGVLSMILEKKPDINATDCDDWTALHLTLCTKLLDIAKPRTEQGS